MNILLVEDERALALGILRILARERHHIDWHTNGADGLLSALAKDYDLVILDILLPKMNGWDVCRRIRLADRNVPILMLSAMDEAEDKVRGLNLGADDFLAKPFDSAELVARVRAQSRRELVHRGPKIQIGDLRIDQELRRVARAEVEVPLTRIEFDILVQLAAREGQVVKPAALAQDVAEINDPLGRPVESWIGSLRAKIDAPSQASLIQEVDGGYAIGFV